MEKEKVIEKIEQFTCQTEKNYFLVLSDYSIPYKDLKLYYEDEYIKDQNYFYPLTIEECVSVKMSNYESCHKDSNVVASFLHTISKSEFERDSFKVAEEIVDLGTMSIFLKDARLAHISSIFEH